MSGGRAIQPGSGKCKGSKKERHRLCSRTVERPMWLTQATERGRKRGSRDRQGLDPLRSYLVLGLENTQRLWISFEMDLGVIARF